MEEKLYLHSKCHIKSPTWAYIEGKEIIIECAECGEKIVNLRLKLEEELECRCEMCASKN